MAEEHNTDEKLRELSPCEKAALKKVTGAIFDLKTEMGISNTVFGRALISMLTRYLAEIKREDQRIVFREMKRVVGYIANTLERP